MDAAAPGHDAATMWLGHAIAALVTIVVFAYAEATFWGLGTTARLLFRRLYALVGAVPARTPAPAVPVARIEAPAALTRLLSPLRRRGPPAFLCA
jgi:hypothetical protein